MDEQKQAAWDEWEDRYGSHFQNPFNIKAEAETEEAFSEAYDAGRASLFSACERLLTRYLSLANSGDCGFWNPEKEEEIQEARAALGIPATPG